MNDHKNKDFPVGGNDEEENSQSRHSVSNVADSSSATIFCPSRDILRQTDELTTNAAPMPKAAIIYILQAALDLLNDYDELAADEGSLSKD
jgi:hypothetical protein